MKHLAPAHPKPLRTLWWSLTLAAALALAACGGGNGSAAPAASPQTITFASPGDRTIGSAAATLSAVATSGLAVTIASKTTAVCTVSGTALTLAAAGTCTLAADQAGNGAYAPAPEVLVSFSVFQAQTIAFASPGNQTLGVAPAALVATASSGLPTTITSLSPGSCTVSGSTLTLLAAGACTLAADQPGDSTYAAAPQAVVAFTVTSCAATAGSASDLVSFNDPTLAYAVAAFNGATGAVVADPTSGCNEVGALTRTPGAQYDGATFGDLPPASSPTIAAIPFTAASNTLTLRVYVPAAPVLVHLKIENAANGA
ncbi:MAG: hypothetical protein KGJ24_07840, partial [Burkholderiales bacterium]|nr:hypothetical protein [Burkholderiales bacterium]